MDRTAIAALIGLGVALTCAAPSPALAQGTPTVHLTIVDPRDPGNGFGGSVDIDGDRLVTGAPYSATGGMEDSGIAWVYDATTGTTITTLNNPTPEPFEYFGLSVAISGNLALVSATGVEVGGESGAGAVYVFDATNGSLLRTLTMPAPDSFSNFGNAVAIDGNLAVIGAKDLQGSGGEFSVGRAFVFNADTGAFVIALNNPTPGGNDRFGFSVAIEGQRAVVGSHNTPDGNNFFVGEAYVFNAMTGALETTLANPEPAPFDFYGNSVAIDNASIVVGSPGEDVGGVFSVGRAYVYDATTFAYQQTLDNPDPGPPELFSGDFGWSVAVAGGVAVVGAPRNDIGGQTNSGNVYYFDLSGGALAAARRIPPPKGPTPPVANSQNGNWVALRDYFDGSSFGAAGTNPDPPIPPVVYVFEISGGVETPIPTLSPSPSPSPSPSSSPSPSPSATRPTCPPNKFIAAARNEGAIGVSSPSSVKLKGGVIAIGEPDAEVDGKPGAGLVHIAYPSDPIGKGLYNPVPEAGDEFGHAVDATNSGLLVVSAPGATSGGKAKAGKVFIFRSDNCEFLGVLESENPTVNGRFGQSIHAKGSTKIIVGAPGEKGGEGSVYKFTIMLQNGLSLAAGSPTKIDNPGQLAGQGFGSSVASTETGVVASAPGAAGGAGTIYGFADNGALVWTLPNPQGANGGGFGLDLGASQEVLDIRIVVGAPHNDAFGQDDCGVAYVIDGADGSVDMTISPPYLQAGALFGASVDICEDWTACGMPGAGPNGSGEACLYSASGAYIGSVYCEDPMAGDACGTELSIANDLLAVIVAGKDIEGFFDVGEVDIYACVGVDPPPAPPLFILHPANQFVNEGQPVRFTVDATGIEPITFQWQKDGAPLPGETGKTLLLDAASVADEGAYRCEASSIGGLRISNPANLDVYYPSIPNSSNYLGTSAPPQMTAGSSLIAGFTMQNTSMLSWSEIQGYVLVVISDPDGFFQGRSNIPIYDTTTVVPPEGAYQFISQIYAPSTPGDYVITLQMAEDPPDAPPPNAPAGAKGTPALFGAVAQISIKVVPPANEGRDWSLYE